MTLPQSREGWEAFATATLQAFLSHEGAILKPEAEARLSEGGWITEHLDPLFPLDKGPQPHHLSAAFRNLTSAGAMEPETSQLSGRAVTSYLDVRGLADRRATSIRNLAASKRRLYRTFLSWTANPLLCGSVSERIVHASLTEVAGRTLLLAGNHKPGGLDRFLDRPVPIGPLDDGGFWVRDPANPVKGLIPFGVEVKNLRGWTYPWDHEVWELLTKMAAFPDAVPVLVARRIHTITFHMFRDLGVIGHQTHFQWFTNPGTTRASIDPMIFQGIKDQFGFNDATLVEEPDLPNPFLVRFFGVTAHRPVGQETLIERSARLWERAAPIAGQYSDLRRSDLQPATRREQWADFCEKVANAGLYDRDQWAPPDIG